MRSKILFRDNSKLINISKLEMVFVFLLSFFILFVQVSSEKICKDLQIGTSIGTNDIIKYGVPDPLWDPNISESAVISASKSLDFFYLSEPKFELGQSNIKLAYDNSENITSQAVLKRHAKSFYTIQISYDCNSNGGILANFNLEIEVPNCGSTTVGWKKMCGNPFSERKGFTVEMLSGDSSRLIVKDGKVTAPEYFDNDIQNYAFLVPTYTNQLRLELFMDIDNMKDLGKTITPDTYVSKIRADSDKGVVSLQMQGEIINKGGVLNNLSKKNIDMVFNCTKTGGNSTVELDILLNGYKDITLYLTKSCETQKEEGYSIWTLILWLSLFVVIGFIYTTYKNNGQKDKQGLRESLLKDIQLLYSKIKSFAQVEKSLFKDKEESSGDTENIIKKEGEYDTQGSNQKVNRASNYGSIDDVI